MPNGTLETLAPVTNDGEETILGSRPYVATVTIRGVCPMLFHAWSVEAVAEKAAAKKGSDAKKSDNVESYVYRNSDGHICIPGSYILGSMIDKRNGSAKFRADPRSPRKSALDLYKGGVVAVTDLAPIIPDGQFGPTSEWDYLDRRRVVVNQSGITRVRPAFKAGWTAEAAFLVLVPEYVSPADLHACLTDGGKLVGTGDFRPTFGRFQVDRFAIGLED